MSAATPTPAPSNASNIQTQSQRLCGVPYTGATGRAPAMAEAASAVTPSTTMPHPGTAVNEPARSMAERMNWRLSSARSCRGRGAVMTLSKALCHAKSRTPSFESPDQLETRPHVVHRGHFHVDEAGGQGDLAHDVFGQIGRHAGRLLGPRNPQRAGGLERA